MPVSQQLSSDPVAESITEVPPTLPLSELAALMTRRCLSKVRIVDGGRVIGVVTERDVIRAVGDRLSPDAPVSVLMGQPAPASLASTLPLTHLYDAIPDPVWLKDPQGVYLACNPAMATCFGVPQNAIMGKTDFDFVDRDTAEHYRRMDQEAIATGQSRRNEEWLIFPDGRRRLVETTKTPIFRTDGSLLGVLGIAHDITERHQIESQLRQLSQAVEQSPLSILITDLSGAIEYVNPYFTHITGYSREEVIGRNPHILKSGQTPPEEYQRLWRTIRAGNTWTGEFHNRRKDGSLYWEHATITPIRDAGGRIVQYLGIKQNITEQKRLENELRQRERYQRALLDNFPFLVWLKDTESRFLAVNQPFADACGQPSPDAVAGKTDLDVWPRDLAEHYRADDREVLGGRRKKTVEEEIDSPRGRVWFETYKAPVMDSDGILLGMVGFARDITERKEAEAATRQSLVEAKRLAQARSDFLANMSHEIRTPLNVILGLTQAARRQSLDVVMERYLGQIGDAGHLLLGVVNDILDFSKIEAGKLALEQAPFHLDRVIDQVIALVAPRAYGKGLVLELEEAIDLPAIWRGDGFRLSQILVNLLGNAVKFTEQGRVGLAVRRTGDPAGSDGLAFVIEDSGIGMAPEKLKHLFEPFEQADSSTTRRFGGTGLGLAICKRLVDLMAGEIRVDSRPDQGSVFEVRVPLQPEEHDETLPGRSPRSVLLAGLAAAEAGPLSEALRERGLDVIELPVESIGIVTGFDLLVVDSAALADTTAVAVMRVMLDRGQRILVVVTPGVDTRLPGSLRGRVGLVERPLNPRRLLAAAQVRPEAVVASQRLAGLRVLAVEDNPVNQLVLAELLAQEGARMTLAGHGVEALARLAEQGVDAFDLVLTDIQMPEMDGYETTRRIQALAPGLPVIGLTAHAMPEERGRCLAAGMCDHVAKPIDLDVLVEAIHRHVTVIPTFAGARLPAPRTGQPITPVPADCADLPVVDWDALEGYFGGEWDVIDKLVAMTLQTQASAATELREAVDRMDWKRLVSLAHSIKGLSGHLSARRSFGLAARVEDGARRESPDAPELARNLADALDELMAALAARHMGSAQGMADQVK